MTGLNSYLSEYSESHQNKQNILIHNVCVPAIMWSLLGLLAAVPLFAGLNLSHLVALLALAYYATFKNWRVLAGMSVVTALMVYSFQFVPNLTLTSISVFIIAWLGQFYGHKVEGKKPSFLKDLQFLLIGPVWVMAKWAPGFFRVV